MPYGLLDEFPGMRALYIEKQPLNVITEEDMSNLTISFNTSTSRVVISYLTHDIFKHNLNMKFIRFEENPIKYIEPGFFANLAKQPPMERVRFGNCGCIDMYIFNEEKYLFELPEIYQADSNHTCNDLTQVQTNAKYSNIECGIFGDNSNSRCKFFVYDEDTLVNSIVFAGSTGSNIIKYITITSSVMRFIPLNFGAKLKQLKQLMIESVGLMRISKESLSAEMKSLQVLNLAKNALVIIPNDAFEYLTSLETLDLSYNNIYSFDGATVADLPKLKHLSLSGNGLKSIIGDLFNVLPKTIATVSLQNNGCIDMKYPDDRKSEISLELKGNCTVTAECLDFII